MALDGYWLTAAVAREALGALEKGEKEIEISPDLNLSRRVFPFCEGALVLDSENRLTPAELRALEGKESRIFYLEGGELNALEVRDGGYVKLVPTDGAPLLEISGIKMHISKGIDPFASAGRMAAQVVRKGARVLDTCSGLGYAAITAQKLGASEVVSVERSATVEALRRKNPWSQELFEGRIRLVQGDVNEYIRTLPAASFDAVIHDPPRFSLAGELYGEPFYREIHRILKRGGALFHYTGNPHRVKRGSRFIEQAARRLKGVGFVKVTQVPTLMGITACK